MANILIADDEKENGKLFFEPEANQSLHPCS